MFHPAGDPVRRTADRRPLALALAAVVLAVPAGSAAQGRWVGTLATGPVTVEPPPSEVRAQEVPMPAPRTTVRLRNQTIRQVVVRTSIGGSQVRATPRTPWGAPDLGGVWDFRTLTPLERPAALGEKAVLTPEEAAEFRATALESRNADRRDGGARRDVERAYNDFWWDYGDSLTADLRTSLIVDPPDGRIPPRVEGIDEADDARRAARRRPVRERVVIGSPAHGPEDLGLSERCMLGFNAGPPMLPSAYNNNIHILQTPDHVVIFNEMVHDARIVPLGDVPHLPGTVRQWLGDSRGRWEGDTLVVESTNFTHKTGSFYTIARSYGSGETARLVERFTREDDDRLRYEFTVDDPATFTQPFTAMIPMTRTDAPLFEYACHEGNYGMTNLLAGARVQENEAAAAGR